MPVTIHGKEYKTVAERLSGLHGDDDSWSLTSELLHVSGDEVIIKASPTNTKAHLILIRHPMLRLHKLRHGAER